MPDNDMMSGLQLGVQFAVAGAAIALVRLVYKETTANYNKQLDVFIKGYESQIESNKEILTELKTSFKELTGAINDALELIKATNDTRARHPNDD